MTALSHITKVYAVQDCQISQLMADPSPDSVPSAPSAPGAPTITNAGTGAAAWGYKIVFSNGVDSAQSSAGTTATGEATPALLASDPNVVTLAAAVPVGQVARIIRTAAPGGAPTGLLATLAAGATAFSDNGAVVPITYVPDLSGILYNPKIKVPGIKTIEVSGTVKTGMLRGDFSLLDAFAVLTDLKITFNFAKASWDVYGVVVGGTVTDSGSTPNRVSRWRLKRTTANNLTDRFHYFKLEGQSVGADPVNGDVHFDIPKCIADAFPKLGMAEEDYETFTCSAIAIPRINDDVWIDAVVNETSTQIGVGF